MKTVIYFLCIKKCHCFALLYCFLYGDDLICHVSLMPETMSSLLLCFHVFLPLVIFHVMST